MKTRLLLIFLLLCSTLMLSGYVDPLSVLEQLPAPNVEYPDAPKNSYPTIKKASDTSQPLNYPTKTIDALGEVIENGKNKFSNLGNIIKDLSNPSSATENISKKQQKTTQKSDTKSQSDQQTNILENLETLENNLVDSAKSLLTTTVNNEKPSPKKSVTRKKDTKTTKKPNPRSKPEADSKNSIKTARVTKNTDTEKKT